jgi:hypothetical protein
MEDMERAYFSALRDVDFKEWQDRQQMIINGLINDMEFRGM